MNLHSVECTVFFTRLLSALSNVTPFGSKKLWYGHSMALDFFWDYIAKHYLPLGLTRNLVSSWRTIYTWQSLLHGRKLKQPITSNDWKQVSEACDVKPPAGGRVKSSAASHKMPLTMMFLLKIQHFTAMAFHHFIPHMCTYKNTGSGVRLSAIMPSLNLILP